MRRTGDQALVKEINMSIVLEMIIRQEPISRASISSMTGLNKGTVSSLVQELMDRHLVFETGTGLSSGGRKPVLLQFCKEAGYAIGVDLGVNFIHAVLTNLKGNIIEQFTVYHDNESEQSVIDLLIRTIGQLVASIPQGHYGLIGIGLGIPGIVDSDGQILFAPNMGWRSLHLGEQIRTIFNVPVHVDNEANAGAIGEQQYGDSRRASNMLFISAGIGIGAGMIIDNEIYRGASGFSGEVGHLTIDSDGRLCRCGNRGCWELYASENALLALADHVIPMKKGALTLEQIADLARDEHPGILQALGEVGRYLGIGIAGLINTLNPKLIIIGNRLGIVARYLESAMQTEIGTRSLKFHRDAVTVKFTDLHAHSIALGAAYMAISAFLANIPRNQSA